MDLNGNGVLDPEDIIWVFSDGEDDDENGYMDDTCGWNSRNDKTSDESATATHAGEIWAAGRQTTPAALAGACPNAMFLPVRVAIHTWWTQTILPREWCSRWIPAPGWCRRPWSA